MLKDKRIVESGVFLTDIAAEGYTINIEYLSVQLDIRGFNMMREDIYLKVIDLIEKMDLQMAGSERNVRIITDQPSSPEGSASVAPTA